MTGSHHHATREACNYAPLTLNITLLGHRVTPLVISVKDMKLTELVGDLKDRLIVELEAMRTNARDECARGQAYNPPFPDAVESLVRRNLVLVGHGTVMQDDEALCNYSVTAGTADLMLALDLSRPQYVYFVDYISFFCLLFIYVLVLILLFLFALFVLEFRTYH
jgi:hypothetical protein